MNHDDIIRMAREAGFWVDDEGTICGGDLNAILPFAELVAAAEREECACEAEGIANSIHGYDKHGYAEAIRARGGSD